VGTPIDQVIAGGIKDQKVRVRSGPEQRNGFSHFGTQGAKYAAVVASSMAFAMTADCSRRRGP